MRADTLLLLRDRAQSGGGLLLPAPAAAALLDLIEAACQLHDAEEVMGEALAISAITDIREAEADIKDALRQLQAAIQSARALPELQPAAFTRQQVLLFEGPGDLIDNYPTLIAEHPPCQYLSIGRPSAPKPERGE